MNKTESKLMQRLADNSGCCGVVGTRERNAARNLKRKGLVEFVDTSEYISPQRSGYRKRNGDYKGYSIISGKLTSLDLL